MAELTRGAYYPNGATILCAWLGHNISRHLRSCIEQTQRNHPLTYLILMILTPGLMRLNLYVGRLLTKKNGQFG